MKTRAKGSSTTIKLQRQPSCGQAIPRESVTKHSSGTRGNTTSRTPSKAATRNAYLRHFLKCKPVVPQKIPVDWQTRRDDRQPNQ